VQVPVRYCPARSPRPAAEQLPVLCPGVQVSPDPRHLRQDLQGALAPGVIPEDGGGGSGVESRVVAGGTTCYRDFPGSLRQGCGVLRRDPLHHVSGVLGQLLLADVKGAPGGAQGKEALHQDVIADLEGPASSIVLLLPGISLLRLRSDLRSRVQQWVLAWHFPLLPRSCESPAARNYGAAGKTARMC